MARQDNHGIIWCDETWNPMRGCSPVSAGCDHCWARRMAARFCAAKGFPYNGNIPDPYYGFVERTASGPQWTGKVALIESELEKPLHWRKPRRIAVGLMGDLFRLPFADIDRIYTVMALCPQHTFLLLTKQAKRMAEYSTSMNGREPWSDRVMAIRRATVDYAAMAGYPKDAITFPLTNVHLGVSAEDQATLEDRVKWLLRTPAAHRWLSLEPLLGPVDLARYIVCQKTLDECHARGLWPDCAFPNRHKCSNGLDHVVVGGESGPGARPMHPDWARKVRDQCQAAGVPFTFKQWGEWLPADQFGADGDKPSIATTGGARVIGIWPDGSSNGLKGADGYMEAYRVGKRAAGRMLDGRTWEGAIQ